MGSGEKDGLLCVVKSTRRERDAEIIWYAGTGGVKNEVLQLPSLVLIAFPCVRRSPTL
jgi:hypothetical protein